MANRYRGALAGSLLVLIIAGCGGAAAPSSVDSSARPAAITPSPVPAIPTAGASAPGQMFSGNARVLIEIDGVAHELTGGRCDLAEFPADVGGGWYFALNLGTPSTEPNGPDYVGMLVEVPDGAAPDGEYSGQAVLATATVAGYGFNVGEAVVTLTEGGRAGTFTGETRPDNKPVRGSFSC